MRAGWDDHAESLQQKTNQDTLQSCCPPYLAALALSLSLSLSLSPSAKHRVQFHLPHARGESECKQSEMGL